MKKILIVTGTVNGDKSLSFKLINDIRKRTEELKRNINYEILDLYNHKFGQMTDYKDNKLIEEACQYFKSFHSVIIISPLYYYNVSPYILNWINKICQNNITYKMNEYGEFETILNFNFILISTRGGYYHNNHLQNFPYDLEYLKSIFGQYLGGKIKGIFSLEGFTKKYLHNSKNYDSYENWIARNMDLLMYSIEKL